MIRHLILAVALQAQAGAQLPAAIKRPPDTPPPPQAPPVAPVGLGPAVVWAAQTAAQPSPRFPERWAPFMSALVPGAGQLTLGQDRFMAYAATEVLLWLKYTKDRRAQANQEREYRALARDVSRVHFSMERPDGDWDYYETMERWFESGAYSLSQTELVPERDPATFNGNRWLLAQRNHGIDESTAVDTDEAYRAALAEYASRAIGPEYLWSWRNARLEWDLYRRTINKRNDAAHAVGLDVTLLLANRVLSIVDAFASYRLRADPGNDGGITISARLPLRR